MKDFYFNELQPDSSATAIAREYAENFYKNNNGAGAPDFETLENYLFAYHVRFDKNGKLIKYDVNTPTTRTIFERFCGLFIYVVNGNFNWICRYAFDDCNNPIFEVNQYNFGVFKSSFNVLDIPPYLPTHQNLISDSILNYIADLHKHLENLLKNLF